MGWAVGVGTEFGNPSIEIPNGATVVECCNTMVNLAKKGIRAPKIMHREKERVKEHGGSTKKTQRYSILSLLKGFIRLALGPPLGFFEIAFSQKGRAIFILENIFRVFC